MTLIKKTNIFKSITSILALDWKTVCDLWQSWAKAALRAVIFCRPSYVSSHWSGSISPRSKSKSTKALSNSFSKISSQRNDRVAAISTSIILHVKQQLLKYLLILAYIKRWYDRDYNPKKKTKLITKEKKVPKYSDLPRLRLICIYMYMYLYVRLRDTTIPHFPVKLQRKRSSEHGRSTLNMRTILN